MQKAIAYQISPYLNEEDMNANEKIACICILPESVEFTLNSWNSYVNEKRKILKESSNQRYSKMNSILEEHLAIVENSLTPEESEIRKEFLSWNNLASSTEKKFQIIPLLSSSNKHTLSQAYVPAEWSSKKIETYRSMYEKITTINKKERIQKEKEADEEYHKMIEEKFRKLQCPHKNLVDSCLQESDSCWVNETYDFFYTIEIPAI